MENHEYTLPSRHLSCSTCPMDSLPTLSKLNFPSIFSLKSHLSAYLIILQMLTSAAPL